MRSLLLVPCVLLVAPACGKKQDKPADPATTAPKTATTGSATPPPATPPAGAGKPFEANFEGVAYKFVSARIATSGSSDKLVFSTGALPCDAEPKPEDLILEVTLEQGPGGKHFAPGPFEVDTSLYKNSDYTELGNESLYTVLTLESGQWKTGDKVKGTVRVDSQNEKTGKPYTGAGSFEATVCTLEPHTQVAPETADAGPVSGTLGDQKFVAKSGLAWIQHDDKRNEDSITMIDLYDSVVGCENQSDAKGIHVIIGGDSGTRGKDVFVGTPQYRKLSYRLPAGGQNFVNGPSWAKFDAIKIEENGEIKGTFYAEADAEKVKEDPKAAAKLSGTFTAKVCKF